MAFGCCMDIVSCGTVKKYKGKPAVALAQSSLTSEQQAEYDYFFLEAMRLKEKRIMVAFGLLQHCMDIHRMRLLRFMRFRSIICFSVRLPQGQEALEKGCGECADILWYSQGLASLYQQQNEWIRLSPCWNRWWYVYLPSRTPLFLSTFWTCMAD